MGSPAGISCPGDCVEAFNSGISVTLTAKPDAGSSFEGWSGGGCSGTATCIVTMNADTSVTATFTPTTPTTSVTPNSLDFGNVAVGSSADQTFIVKNTGKGILSGGASTSAPFSIVGTTFYSLGANEPDFGPDGIR